MAKIIKATQKFLPLFGKAIFLCGSIEMGTAENWQEKVEAALKHLAVTILNPRRDDWDSSWIQSIENEKFREQVEWELLAQETADIIAVYFSPGTKSPINLLELGLFSHKRKGGLIVCCPEGFWRKGNVDIVCDRYEIEHYENFEPFLKAIIKKI